ncbi:hypothetical protein ACPCVL_15070 [Streptomyces koyangensis]
MLTPPALVGPPSGPDAALRALVPSHVVAVASGAWGAGPLGLVTL